MYGITVYLQKTCILKSARAFLVFKSVENKGELIKSVPSTEQIEDEEFDFDFSWIFASSDTKENIKKLVMNVSEIAEVYIDDIEIPDVPVAGPSNDVKPAQEKKETAKPDAKEKPKKASASKGKVGGRSVRVDIDKLDVLMNLVSELIIAKNGLVSASAASSSGQMANAQAFHEQIEYLERVTTNLHESVMKVRMVPIESVVNRFPRMIRDLNRKLNKKMELYMTGEETELMKSGIRLCICFATRLTMVWRAMKSVYVLVNRRLVPSFWMLTRMVTMLLLKYAMMVPELTLTVYVRKQLKKVLLQKNRQKR